MGNTLHPRQSSINRSSHRFRNNVWEFGAIARLLGWSSSSWRPVRFIITIFGSKKVASMLQCLLMHIPGFRDASLKSLLAIGLEGLDLASGLHSLFARFFDHDNSVFVCCVNVDKRRVCRQRVWRFGTRPCVLCHDIQNCRSIAAVYILSTLPYCWSSSIQASQW